MTTIRSILATLLSASMIVYSAPAPSVGAAIADPPLAASSNVTLIRNIPGTAAGMTFRGHYAFVTGWEGLTVFDIKQPANPTLIGGLPLAHFENEDVDVCKDTLLISEDRAVSDLGAVLNVTNIADPAQQDLGVRVLLRSSPAFGWSCPLAGR